MTTTIDGRLTTDMSFWINFGSAGVELVIKNIKNIRGLELSGTLTPEDCESISRRGQQLEYLDLLNTTFPDNTVPENFLCDAANLDYLRLPGSIKTIRNNAFANCHKLGNLQVYIG